MKGKVFKRVIAGVKVGAVTLFAGVPLPYVLAISAGLISLEALWEVQTEKKDLLTLSGLSFLIQVKQKTRQREGAEAA
ncbi:MAG TPA: hypothetical protein VHT52_18740 [Stellaceae bacterium]|nr:hypothetical protein [Stellaceae bacterium]